METISAEEIDGNFSGFLAKVSASGEPVIVTNNDQSAVLMSLAEFQSLQETLYLLSNPANAAHLQKSICDLDQGRGIEVDMTEL